MLPPADNPILAELARKRDKATFAVLLWTGPLTARLDAIAKLLNR